MITSRSVTRILALPLAVAFATACNDQSAVSPSAPGHDTPSLAAPAAPTYSEIELGAGMAYDVNARGMIAMWREIACPPGPASCYEAGVWRKGTFTPIGAELYDPPFYRFQMEINNRGHVVGAMNSTGDMRGFLWNGRELVDLGPYHGRGINERGQVVGLTKGDAGLGTPTVAALWERGQLTRTADLGGTFNTANAINQRGEIAGTGRFAGSNLNHAFLWVGDQITPLGLGDASHARDINQRGEITGTVTQGGAAWGYVWDDGAVTLLNGPGLVGSRGHALSNDGDVAGAINDGALIRAALWLDGNLLVLSAESSQAWGMNQKAEVVGYKDDGTGGFTAVLWTRK
jgi:probable HAF family extracellular repeat protein